jgi:predicted O-methyltransferase YrrM
MSNRTINLDDRLYTYLQSVAVREPEILAKLRAETNQHPQAVMQIAPDQGQFMGLLVQLLGVKKAIEVGTFTGYSSLVMALAMPADGRLITCDMNPQDTAIAQRYWAAAGVSNKIDLRLGKAINTLENLLAQGAANTFDLAFIDADKSSYLQYYEACLELLRPGGLILIDNVLWSGQVADLNITDKRTTILRELNLKIHQDDRVNISLLPVGDGLTLAMKKS